MKNKVTYVTDVGTFVHESEVTRLDTGTDIVSYDVKNVCKKIGDGEDEYVLTPTEFEVSRKKRSDYVNSFNDSVGVKAIEKQLLLNRLPELVDGDGVVDLTKIPDDPVALRQWIIDAKQKYNDSGIDLGSVEQAAGATDEQILAAVQKVLAAQKQEENGGAQ